MTVYLGIDWSETSHALVFLNQKGAVVAQATIDQSPQGFARLDQLRRSLDVAPQACCVGIESSHTLLVDWLWGHGYNQVYVIPPNVTRSRQATYRQSGARTDETDAYLIANLLRTDRHLLYPWRPDTALTQQLRAQVGLRRQLVTDRVRMQNQLRDVLLRYYPAVLQAFNLDTDVGLAFLQSYPTPQAAAELGWQAFQHFARQQSYARTHWAGAFAALQAPQPQPLPETVAAYAQRAVVTAHRLAETRQALKEIDQRIGSLYAEHPDASIYDSLPGIGAVLGPALLTKLGDDRQRFPEPSVLQALAGTAPVTEQSGRRRSVRFRRACDKELRAVAQQWAKSSLQKSPWAVAYFTNARRRGHGTNRTYRALANRWLAILWKLWQTHQPYDEDLHLQCVKERSRPRH